MKTKVTIWKIVKFMFAIGSFIWAVWATIENECLKKERWKEREHSYRAAKTLRSIDWWIDKIDNCKDIEHNKYRFNYIKKDILLWQKWCANNGYKKWHYDMKDQELRLLPFYF